jgi:hypothetical protein
MALAESSAIPELIGGLEAARYLLLQYERLRYDAALVLTGITVISKDA